ncbi:MAG: methyltransferase domain-containing protein [Kiritimatiellae bacterium]|nr:methyltransferase domain-containing protein [Kiritimatiellia bacterium]
MKEERRKLNIGCGIFRKKGFINVDGVASMKPDVLHDLNSYPYPFEENSFDLTEADHVIEHLKDPFQVMRELHRILNPNGLLVVRVPHFSRGFTHADHRRGFDVSFPYYFQPKFTAGYTGVHFMLKQMKLRWFAQPYLKKKIMPLPIFYIMQLWGWVIDTLANISPFICSRIWCYWVGGFEEILFHFVPVKGESKVMP